MERENPIMLFDWEKDTQETPPPKRAIFNIKKSDGLGIGLDYEPLLVVQADPDDIVTVTVKSKINKKGNNGEERNDKQDDVEEVLVKKNYHMHPLMWLNTLDEYIYQYCRVYELLCNKQESLEWIEVVIHDTVESKLLNQKKETKNKRKALEVSTDYVKYVRHNALSEAGGGRYKIPKHGAPLYLNCLYRDFCTPANATKKKLELEYDGRKYIEGDWIPDFSFIDYYWHEAITGIALSIEITSVLLEVQNKLHDNELWEKAFDEFCKKALPTIAKSRMYFTRNTIARVYFQQIYLEQTIRSYEWGTDEKEWKISCADWEENEVGKVYYGWESLIKRALIPCGLLKSYPYEPDIPEEELEESLSHLWELLCGIEKPIDFVEYIENPTHGLVLFCNPAHENVTRFLNELGTGVDAGKKEGIKPYERRIFTRVHREIKAAIHRK